MTAVAITLYALVVVAAVVGISAGLAVFVLWVRTRRARKRAHREDELAEAVTRVRERHVEPDPDLPDDDPPTEELPAIRE